MIEIAFRVVLAGVLAYAALAKLRSPAASRAGMEAFGFGDGPLRRIAWGSLIVIELGLAAGVAAGIEAAAFAAAALMLLFAALTVSALLRGAAGAPCACFGARSRVSRLSVLRNLGLAAAFACIPFVDSAEIGTEGWLGIGIGVALAACAALAVAVLALAREVGMLRLRLGTEGALEIEGEGPELGTQTPDLAGRLPLDSERFGLAVFTSEGCHLCQTLAPAIENVARDPLVAVAVFDEVVDADLWRALAIPGSPFAVAIGAGGTVLAKGTFNSLAQLESVLGTAERRSRGAVRGEDRDLAERIMGKLPIGA